MSRTVNSALPSSEVRDVGQPLRQPRSEGCGRIRVHEHVGRHKRQVDAAQEQQISQAFGSASGIHSDKADIVASGKRSRDIASHCEIGGTLMTGQNHQCRVIELLLQRPLLGQQVL